LDLSGNPNPAAATGSSATIVRKSTTTAAAARSNAASPAPTSYPSIKSTACLGRHLARRLVEVGCTDVFSVPGDFNLILLDHLLAEPGLNNIG
jgi:pyruvate decarboxylase